MQASFSNPLQAGKTYALECFVSLGYEGQSFCLSDLGFYFSDTLVSEFTGEVINVIPQYENPVSNMINTHHGWQRIEGTYTAHGGEKYVSIGVFKPYSITHLDTCDAVPGSSAITYMFIDDVAVYDTAKVDSIHLCVNDSVLIGGNWRHNAGIYTDIVGGLPVKFYIEPRSYSAILTLIDKPFVSGDSVRITLLQTEGNDSTSSIQNFIWVSHDTTIDIPMYNIYGCDSTVRYRCGTNIGLGKELNNQFDWDVYPNPANDFIEIKLKSNDLSSYSLSIWDISGKELHHQALQQNKLDVTTLNSGMYFVKLLNIKTDNVVGVKKFVKE